MQAKNVKNFATQKKMRTFAVGLTFVIHKYHIDSNRTVDFQENSAIIMEKFFTTEGAVKPDIHYCLDPLRRINIDELESLINAQKYFVLHAPRQTGKTTSLLALRDYLNQQGRYVAVYANVEMGQAYRNDVAQVQRCVIGEIGSRMSTVLKDDWPDNLAVEFNRGQEVSLAKFLKTICSRLTKPLVLFLDEIDALVGDSLVSVLRSLRSGYDQRPEAFPQSVILCGVRDVRDYRIVLSNQDIITGGSAFNIKAKSLRIGNFTKEDIRELYMQHTAATGQEFDESCFPMVWEATEGQPWLVNALAYEVTHEMKENRDRSVRIIPEMMFRAQENLIYRRVTHLDILIDKLREDRVRRVIQPILANSEDEAALSQIADDDIQYVEDMGLIKRDKPYRISNGIYKEVIPRELTWARQQSLLQQPVWYKNADGSINTERLIKDFQQYWRQNSEWWTGRFDYAEAGPQLMLQCYLQRIINGGGYIVREYGLGRGRTDLLIIQPLTEQYGGPVQRIVLELKMLRGTMRKTLAEALPQTFGYMDHAGNINEGHILIFDRTTKKPWSKKIFCKEEEYEGRKIKVWGL